MLKNRFRYQSLLNSKLISLSCTFDTKKLENSRKDVMLQFLSSRKIIWTNLVFKNSFIILTFYRTESGQLELKHGYI